MVILENNENFDVSAFCSPFHDGEIYYIKNYGDSIRIYMTSFPLYLENDGIYTPNPQYFKLTSENKYKGYLLLEDVIDWSISKNKNCEFFYDYIDSLEILDFEIEGNKIDFLVIKRFFLNEKIEEDWLRYIFHANSIKWVNFEHISEDEYDCEDNKDYFFEDIRGLMDKPQN